MRERWLGATGVQVPEIAVEGEDVAIGKGGVEVRGESYDALVLDGVADLAPLRRAHEEGLPVLIRAGSAEAVLAALARPEVACALVPADQRQLLELDLVELTYG
jgi:hypothetical protein